jgi:DNA polymerase I-like protein with 3'-5' exonuclease and polymerase domains
VTTIDFETESIEGRPAYPPKPVGVSIKEPGKKSRYLAWGHPEENNCTAADAKRQLKAVWKPGVLFYNGKFDTDVAETHLGMRRLPADDVHDTMFLMFLRDPHARQLDLKGLAERFLGEPPDEQDELKAWILGNKKMLESKYGKFKPSEWGSMISKAPGKLVGRYACGDTDRTFDLFKSEWDYVINEHDMHEAYVREQRVMPLFLDNERIGIRIDVKRLRKDVKVFSAALEAADNWLRQRLKADISFDNDAQVLEALLRAKIVREDQLALTPTGKFSISKKTLTPDLYKDPRVASAFGYRNRMSTCLKMFMLPWLAQAEARGDGRISTNWNQVRGGEGGTRTGRPSTRDPNFLNISKSWDANDDGYDHPAFLHLDPLPLVRRYLLPDDGETWLHRDYNGQELRLLAHFEDGPLLAAYQEDPWLDVHQYVADLIEQKTGKSFVRKSVKIANFRIIYGGGAPATASGIGCSMEEAKDLLAAHGAALPSINGRGGLSAETKAIGKRGDCLYTWGGRAYYVESPAFNKRFGREMTFEYKLLNYLCQGSAADVTKQAMINYNEHPKRKGRFLVQVYDELNVSSGPDPKAEMAVLRDSMEIITEQLDVPLLSEGKSGKTWGDLKKFEEGKSDYE